jgi:hypothetical protein
MLDRTRVGPRRAKGVPELARGDEQPNVRYRRLAQLYLNIPPNTLPPHARHSLLEMAKTWLRLAEEYEKLSGAQPVAQQQPIPPNDRR